MEYVLAAVILAVLSFCVWIGVEFYQAGQDKKEVDERRRAAKQRRKGDEIMAEPVAEETGWLASARRRLRRMQDDPDD